MTGGTLSTLKRRIDRRRVARQAREPEPILAGPIRGELLGADRLAARAREVARSQRVAPPSDERRPTPLLTRLEDTLRVLEASRARVTAAADAALDIGPAGEWLLDNFHVVQEHVREVRESLPRDYYRELPELAAGPLAGYPRVYELAITLIAHTEGRIDPENVSLVTSAFQEVTPLTIGELWAAPAMLRLGLLENVRRMTLRTVQRLDEMERADRWAARILAASEAGDPGTALRDFIARHPPLTPIFVSRFLHQLRLGEGPFTPLLWLEQYIAEEGVPAEDAAVRAADRLAVTQVAMANSITSLRAIGHMDWRAFVERHSVVERILRTDPSGFHPRMTFETRDRYRHAVERIAKRTGRAEQDVAAEAVRLATEGAAEHPDDARRRHVGYYLVDRGVAELERRTGYRSPIGESVYRWVLRHPNALFVGGVLLGSITALAAAFWLGGAAAREAWALVLVLALLPAVDIAVQAVNQLVTVLLPPRTLPKLELRADEGADVPEDLATAIVVPILLGSVDGVREALERLEVHYLANRERNLHFALLSDLTDAATETTPADAAIVAAAREGIRALNARYAGGREDVFYLFHRPRLWNPAEGVWMGWERKRGKLADFNRFLREGDDGAFSTIVGDVERLRRVRYVITLDADTVLPPEAAALLIGAMAHPLNRAVHDPALGRVVRGYGILQPRVGVSLPSAHRSRFAAIQSGHPGVDPYTTAVSDVYQDLYGEGSYAGKGIYDVDAFERATRGRFPENTLLSHDLIEGSYARAGLASEILVYDDYPSRYLAYTRRKHRWIRGDWQLLRWLGTRVPGPDGPEPNRLSLVSRWKIFDNLRRSTIEIAQLAFLVAGWTVLPGSPVRWTVLGVLAIAAPWIIGLLLAAVRPPRDKSWRAYYASVGHDARTSAQQVALRIAFLPHQVWISADAIVRTLWRLFVSRRHLLEWQTASQTERALAGSAARTWRLMWLAVALALAVLALVVLAAPARAAGPSWPLVLAVAPLMIPWLVAPALVRWLDRPALRRARRLTPAQRREAMRYALLHWRYFDRFVTAETQWLAPDNFQAIPAPVVAMRTSPTNVALQLLSTVSAHDLGFLTTEEMVTRLERAFDTLDRMPRFRGHFYNWYDLRDLHVLEPAYVSTVDSGNLAGHLIALRQACLALPDEPVFDDRVWPALDAAMRLAEERLGAAIAGAEPTQRRALAAALHGVRAARAAVPLRPGTSDAAALLGLVSVPLRHALDALEQAVADGVLADEDAAPLVEWIAWSGRMADEQGARVAELAARDEPARPTDRSSERWPTLRELARASAAAAGLVVRLETLAARAERFAEAMDFGFLYDRQRGLFAVGYHTATGTRDASYYDLLASEARLTSYVAIARDAVPVEHWFQLGRTLTLAAGETALVSWSGSMFEYLMPLLVMRSFPHTLLDQTYGGAVRRHVSYGAEHGAPWGVSESAYNLRDRHHTYQYRAFGVPDLALKRGLGRDLVVAPYASALALMVDAQRALANLATLEAAGALGAYGFHDALDYTRPDPGERYTVVRNFMAHHVGMSLVALANALTGQVWQRRFHDDPMMRAFELLLHERIPRRLELLKPQPVRPEEALPDEELEQPAVREIRTPDTPLPHVALLGHLPYTIMLTSGGGGYSRFEGLDVTRWRPDGTRDATGQFCYVRDVGRERVWSVAHQPVCAPADWYHVAFATDRATFLRVDGDFETRTEVAVVPEDAAAVRRVTVTNRGSEPRELEITSYAEVVLAPPDRDRAHPAFANLFVETEWHAWCSAITATRRPRSASEPTRWGVHVVSAPEPGEALVGEPTCETDRARFVGRGRTTRDPLALERDGPLDGTVGAVLDPIFAIRARVRVPPGRSASVAFTTLVAPTPERAFELADRYHDPHTAQRALDLAWTTALVELRELGITPSDAAVFQEYAGLLFFGDPALRAPEEELRRNRGSQPRLWAHGISGDWPILLAPIESVDGLPTLRQLLAAHRYWRRRGMLVDLVILNTRATGYLQELHDAVVATAYALSEAGVMDQPGGVHLRRVDEFDEADLLMLRATARVHVPCDGRSLARTLEVARLRREVEEEPAVDEPPARAPGRATPPRGFLLHLLPPGIGAGRETAHDDDGRRPEAAAVANPHRTPARRTGDGPRLFNGMGGLDERDDYVIHVQGDAVPPAPWINVIANPAAGFFVSERGAGAAWVENSYFYRLTPWHNDPVSDPPGEVLYLRDEESGELWSATPVPVDSGDACTVRHAPGASTFEREHAGIATTLTLGMAGEAAVKVALLRVTNRGRQRRRLTVTSYVEWTLGAQREHTRHQVQTAFVPELGAILARNSFDPQFADWVAFSAISEPVVGHTGDRREFLGRNGDLASPLALRGGSLSGVTGAALDPCAALQCILELAPGATRTVAVILGAAADEHEARRLAEELRAADRAADALGASCRAWEHRLGVVRVHTPEPTFDAMLNRWALYQALVCRMWARTALYQSSGAYGFRDQLQDVMAFVYAEPGIAREHILRAAARQFVEGDVQHWWHPQSGRGVRTRFSDDLAWLPYVVDHYVRVTGDASVLDEEVPFLRMRPLEPHEHEVYDLPEVTDETASVYEHCLRALRRACTTGAHGLPLIGIGDWNDGMSRVGVEGRGESVWLAWFLAATLRAFSDHAEARGELVTASELRARADAYAAAVEAHGWDGAWYRRAYFDDGTPLGTADASECRIDSIAQSWSVISGAGDPARQAQAMRSLEQHLVREDARLIMLLTPPFDRMPNDPGYIKGYLPGVRENGAQYTHAALWAVLATALRGHGDRAFELFQMINPLTHARTPEEVATYKVEPYVVAADVYTAKGQLGRGGWTWYTGSASWLYRVGLEAILGFTKRGDTLVIDPCVPTAWPEYVVDYRHGRSHYRLLVRDPAQVSEHGAEVFLDGALLDPPIVPLVDDGRRHEVRVRPRRAVRR